MADSTTLQRTDSVREAFSNYLRTHYVKFTSARRKILDVVLDLREHFEAEEVLYLLRQRGQRIGKATVYRTLPLLVAARILQQTRFDQRHTYYEIAFGDKPHDHMVCRGCGRIVEFAADEVAALRDRIAELHRFQAMSHRFQISGFCADCSARGLAAEPSHSKDG